MYPAQALADGLYTYQDLPDTVLGTGIFGDKNVVMSRLNPPQPSIDSSGTSYYRGFSLDGGLVGIGLREGDEWVGTEVRNEDAEFGECLISRLPPDTSGTIADQFADTYTVSGPISGTVTRESVCVWRGSNLRLTNFGFQWKVNGNNKSGFQNTPVGSYAGGYTVS
jgi:hypothetical protein